MSFKLPENVVLIFAGVDDMMEFAASAEPNCGCMFSSDLSHVDSQQRDMDRAVSEMKQYGLDAEQRLQEHSISIFHSWRNLNFDGGGVVNDGPTMLRISIEQNAQKVFPQKLYFFTDSPRAVQEIGGTFIKFPCGRRNNRENSLIQQNNGLRHKLGLFRGPIKVELGSLRQALSAANNENFASVIYMTLNKEDTTVPFKQRVESACNVEGLDHRNLHNNFARHNVYFRAFSKGSETTVAEMAKEVKEMFETTGYKKQLFFTDIKELYEELIDSNIGQE